MSRSYSEVLRSSSEPHADMAAEYPAPAQRLHPSPSPASLAVRTDLAHNTEPLSTERPHENGAAYINGANDFQNTSDQTYANEALSLINTTVTDPSTT